MKKPIVNSSGVLQGYGEVIIKGKEKDRHYQKTKTKPIPVPKTFTQKVKAFIWSWFWIILIGTILSCLVFGSGTTFFLLGRVRKLSGKAVTALVDTVENIIGDDNGIDGTKVHSEMKKLPREIRDHIGKWR